MQAIFFLSILIILDLYAIQTLRVALRHQQRTRRWAYGLYAVFSLLVYVGLVLTGFKFVILDRWDEALFRNIFFAFFLTKFIWSVLLLIDDLRRLALWLARKIARFFEPKERFEGQAIPRSEFLAKTGLALTAFPAIATTYGMVVGAHDYRVREVALRLPHLPRQLDGLRIVQLSDIHSGSFFNKTAVRRGIELIGNQKADMVFFTGDLVNNRAREMTDYFEVFNKISAPLGVYSVLGNHDYGTYYRWKTKKDSEQNFRDMLELHQRLGWKLLRNQNDILTIDGEQLAILGVENWSANPRFISPGDLKKTYAGSQDAAIRLLLSHDPSHWRAQVLDYPDIDLMLAGHTHGMQFGVEVGDVRWSPVQMVYPEWAGLYNQNGQYLYVNRGFGYIGLPGRIGIPPEITVITLTKA
ncbi:MAG: metallophosphoesterase [Bernardetiaceae bacterium]